MANELAGKVAIVTGGTMGIGAATAELFVEEGARVVIAGRDAAAGDALAARLGPLARYCRADVGRREDVQALVDFTLAQFGALDVMVNNAGITGTFHSRFLDDDLSDFDEVVRVNLAGVMHGSQIAARHMARHGGGAIINTTSIAAVMPGFALLPYRAAKAGVINFTRSLAIDLGEYRIRVNAIAPGHIPSRLNDFSVPGLTVAQNAELARQIEDVYTIDQPLKPRGQPRDVANAALYFASDRAAYVTGQVLSVDGGVTAGSALNQHQMLKDTRAAYLRAAGLEA